MFKTKEGPVNCSSSCEAITTDIKQSQFIKYAFPRQGIAKAKLARYFRILKKLRADLEQLDRASLLSPNVSLHLDCVIFLQEGLKEVFGDD